MDNDEKLKEGDKVVLKSGGPLMVIERMHTDDSVRCVFFNRHEELKTIDVYLSAIMKATKNNFTNLENEIKILNTEAPL